MTIPAFASQGMELAAAIDAEIKALPVQNTPALRAVRRKYSRILQEDPAEFILQLARDLCKIEAYRWIAYELIRGHLQLSSAWGQQNLKHWARASIVGGPWMHLHELYPGQPGSGGRSQTSL